MNNPFKKKPSASPFRDALLGVLFAIPLAYLLLYGQEILTGTHHLDFAMLANFIWLGVGVMLFAWVENYRTEKVRRRG